jgi:hypothetical protein
VEEELVRPFPHLTGNAVAVCSRIAETHKTHSYCNYQRTRVMIIFLLRLQNYLILGINFLFYQHTALDPPFILQTVTFLEFQITYLAQWLLVYPASCDELSIFLLCRPEYGFGDEKLVSINNSCPTSFYFHLLAAELFRR